MRWTLCILALFTSLSLAAAVNAESETIELKNGDKVTGKVIERNEERVVVESPTLGRVEIPAEAIKPPEPDVKPGLFGTWLLRGWDRELSAGVSGSQGENNDISLSANATASHEDELWAGIWRMNYFLTREDGSTSDNKYFADLLEKRLIHEGSRWSITGDARFDYDETQEWDFRLQGHLGPGYDLFRQKGRRATFRVGAGANQTLSGENDRQWEGLVGLVVRWDITKNLRFRMNNSLLPVLDDLGEFRNVTSASLNLKIPELGGVGVSAGIENDYDSEAEKDDNDLKYFARLVYSF